eukprot:scaffold421_cov125-Isochrysis_galbana.AAC.9
MSSRARGRACSLLRPIGVDRREGAHQCAGPSGLVSPTERRVLDGQPSTVQVGDVDPLEVLLVGCSDDDLPLVLVDGDRVGWLRVRQVADSPLKTMRTVGPHQDRI